MQMGGKKARNLVSTVLVVGYLLATALALCGFNRIGIVIVADAADAECDCGYGTVIPDATKCLCDCTGTTRVLPNCLLEPDAQARIEVTFNTTLERFSSWPMEFALRSRFQLSEYDGRRYIYFRGVTSNTSSTLSGVFAVRASLTQSVLNDLESSAAYLSKFSITAWKVQNVEPSTAYTVIDIPIYMSVSVDTIGWLIGATVTSLFLCCVECIFMSNKEGNPEWEEVEPLHGGTSSCVVEKPMTASAATVHAVHPSQKYSSTVAQLPHQVKESAALPPPQQQAQSHDEEHGVHDDHEEQEPASRSQVMD